jgi:type II secretory pathway pseudopilin PulG
MEEYQKAKHEINQKNPNKGLIAAIVIVIIFSIAAVGGTWYYMNNKCKNDKKAQDAQIQQLQKQIDELKKDKEISESKTKVYNTKYELLKFAYDNGWTISDTSTPKAANSTTDSGRDTIKLTSPNGFVVTIDAGLYGIGGACDTCTVVYSEPLKVLGEQFYINYIQNTENGKGVSTIILAKKADDTFGGINSKNIKGTDGSPSIIMINAKYANGSTVVVKDINTIKTDANVIAYKQMLQSLSY